MNNDMNTLRTILEEIRDELKKLSQIQQQQHQIMQDHYQRAREIQDRAETLQRNSAGMVTLARRTLIIILPIIGLLIAYLSWLLLSL